MNESEEEENVIIVFIDETSAGLRLDKVLATMSSEDISRERIKKSIAEGGLFLNGKSFNNASYKVKTGDEIICNLINSAVPCNIDAENIPLDIVYEDNDLLVINKPAGMVVHPGAGNYSGTLVNALLYHFGDDLSSVGGSERPGIVHRLDKDTSGLMMVAKHDKAHTVLSKALQNRDISRIYVALLIGVITPPIGKIETMIGRSKSDGKKMSVLFNGGRKAITHYKILKNINGFFSLVECSLETGRTHQIRVHMAHINHNIIGDPVYGAQKTAVISAAKKAGFTDEMRNAYVNFPRQALHAAKLSFIHPFTGEKMSFEAKVPEDISSLF